LNSKPLKKWIKNPLNDVVIIGRILSYDKEDCGCLDDDVIDSDEDQMIEFLVTDEEYIYTVWGQKGFIYWIEKFDSPCFAKIQLYRIGGGWYPDDILLSISSDPYPPFVKT
jgi:hypothetical protein